MYAILVTTRSVICSMYMSVVLLSGTCRVEVPSVVLATLIQRLRLSVHSIQLFSITCHILELLLDALWISDA